MAWTISASGYPGLLLMGLHLSLGALVIHVALKTWNIFFLILFLAAVHFCPLPSVLQDQVPSLEKLGFTLVINSSSIKTGVSQLCPVALDLKFLS